MVSVRSGGMGSICLRSSVSHESRLRICLLRLEECRVQLGDGSFALSLLRSSESVKIVSGVRASTKGLGEQSLLLLLHR